MRNWADKRAGGLVARTSKLNRAAGAALEQLETRILFGYYSGDPIVENPFPQPPCLCGPVETLTTNANAGSAGSSTTSAPVMNFDGVPNVSAADLSSGGFGTTWGHTRTWTGLNNASLNGNGWAVSELPYLLVAGGSNGTGNGSAPTAPDQNNGVLSGTRDDHRIQLVAGGATAATFTVPPPNTSATYASYAPWGASQATLTWDSTNNLMRLTDEQGNVTEFHDVFRAGDDSANYYYASDPNRPMPHSLALNLSSLYGRFSRYTSADGATQIAATYSSGGYLTTITRTDGVTGAQERYVYNYTGDSGFSTLTNDLVTAAGDTPPKLIARVTESHSGDGGSTWSTVRSVDYTYYTGRVSDGSGGYLNDTNGRLGDLKLAEVKDAGGSVIDTSYYRYYKFTGEGADGVTSEGPTNKHTTTGGPTAMPTVNVTVYDPSSPTNSHKFVMSGLKTVVAGPSFARLVAAHSNYESLGDVDLTPYVDHYFRYERWDDHSQSPLYINWRTGYRMGTRYRVTEEVAQGTGCSTCSGGQGSFKVDYLENTNFSQSTGLGFNSREYNTWRMRSTEYLPDTTNGAATKILGAGDLASSGTTATVVWVGHHFEVGDEITVSGANEAAYNGTFTITAVPDAYTFKYTLATSTTSPASGTITVTNNDRIDATAWADNDRKIVYTNEMGLPMLEVVVDANGTSTTSDDKQFLTYYRYDNDGRLTFTVHPSALSGYSESNTDLVNFNSSSSAYVRQTSGLIEENVYTTAATGTNVSGVVAGDVQGYLKERRVLNGAADLFNSNSAHPGTLLSSQTYFKVSDTNGASIYPVATETRYRTASATGADPQTTSYAYTWYSNSLQMQSMTVTHPTVSTAQNGPNAATSETSAYDRQGRVVWSKDADGYLTYTAYDQTTGAVTKRIVDVDTSQTGTFAGLPSGWSTPTGGGLHLVTSYDVDSLGRVTRETDPNGHVTYTVYDDDNHEVRTYRGWTSSGSGTNTVYFPTGPVLVSRDDRPGSYNETLTFNYTPGTNATPTGLETISASNIQSLSRKYQNLAGQLDHTDSYFSLSGQTYMTGTNLGTLGTHFLRTSYGYQGQGQLKRVASPDGTIRWTVYDGQNRVVSRWTGTNDTGATNADPTGGGASGNNMLKVAEALYDGGGVGDGLLTESRVVFGSGSGDYYATDYAYDWRDRQTDTRGADKVARRTTLDNLGEATRTDTYADADADFVIDSGELRGRMDVAYDDLGRPYQSTTYNVNPTTGNVTAGTGQDGHALTTNTFYNKRGMVVKVVDPSGLLHKVTYDGAGRATATYVSYDSGTNEATWSGAQDVAGDTVVSQVKTIYDAAGNAVTTTSYDRLESDTTSTGALGAATNQAFIQVHVNWYDAADRLVSTANYGRDNGGTRYVFNTSGALIDSDGDGLPDEAEGSPRSPNTSDDYLAAKYEYDAAGRVVRTTDNVGHVNWAFYDLLGRKTKAVDNVPGTNTAQVETDTDQRRTTEWLFDSAGRLSKQRAWNPKGNDGNTNTTNIEFQDTLYLYESPVDGSWATSTIYPDSSDTTSFGSDQVKTAYDRLGRRTSVTAQQGVAHAYSYDSAGRPSFDAVILPVGPVSIDTAVLGIGSAYDDLGRVSTVTNYAGTNAASTVVNQVKYTYDGWGNVVKSQQEHAGAVGTNTAAVQYTYDDGLPSGSTNTAALHVRLSQVTYPAGRQVFYNYGTSGGIADRLNRVDNIASAASGGAVYSRYHYAGAGRFMGVAHPGSGSAGPQLTFDGNLDRFGRVVRQQWTDVDTTVGGTYDDFVYTYDRNGNVLSKEQNATGAPAGLDEKYAYDGLDRLAKAQRGTLTGTNLASVTFTQDWTGGLDAQGNWASYDNNGTTQTRTANAANETGTITGGSWVSPTYDAAGNMVSGPKAGGETIRLWYVYDAWNRVVAVKNDSSGSPGSTLATYAYDGLNRRVSKATGGHTDDGYFDEQWQVLETRRDGDADAREQYVWEETYVDTPAVRFLDANTDGDVADAGDNTLYYLTDANHNVTAVFDAGTHQVAERYVYDPYGKVTIYAPDWSTTRSTSTVANTTLFAGYAADAETGNYYARNRYYQPTLGRWITRDPLGYVDGANLYQYARSYPTTTVDPLGLFSMGWVGGGFKTVNSDGFIGFWAGLGIRGAKGGVLSLFSGSWHIETQNPDSNQLGGFAAFFYDPAKSGTYDGPRKLADDSEVVILSAAAYTVKAIQFPRAEVTRPNGRKRVEEVRPTCSRGTYTLRWDIEDGLDSRPEADWLWNLQNSAAQDYPEYPVNRDPYPGGHWTGSEFNHKPYATPSTIRVDFQPTEWVEVKITWDYFDNKKSENVRIRSSSPVGRFATRAGRDGEYPGRVWF